LLPGAVLTKFPASITSSLAGDRPMTDDTIETDNKPLPFPDKQPAPEVLAEQDRPAGHDNGWRAPESFDEPGPRPEPQTTATERLAAAEDKLLGEDVARHEGKPERGSGSRFAALHPAHKAHLAAIEHLIAVEAEHAEAEARIAAAHAKVQHALARVEATEEASEAVKD
jgi:hypothetical protein